jgi:4-hydroxy-tetrahydrodipicolinate synthase
MKKLFGVITAMTTPFDAADHVDTAALEKQAEFLIAHKVNCLYPCGTTGEMHLMNTEERELTAETVVKKANHRVTVFIHTGAMRQEETIRLCRHARDIGADGAGIVTPSYFHIDERAMIQYYKDVCGCVPDLPVYVYVIPQCAVNDISASVLEKILNECPNVTGIKYSYPDMARVLEYLRLKSGGLSVVFGPDHLFLPALVMGCDGVVSGCSGPMPELFVDIYAKYLAGDMNAAKAAQVRAAEAVRILRYGSNMSIFKNVLAARGVPGGFTRKPLLDLEEKEREEIINALKPYIGNDHD